MATVTSTRSDSIAVPDVPTQPRHPPHRQIGIKLALSALCFVGLFPYLFMLGTSLKSNQQFAEDYWLPVAPFHWGNYSTAWAQIQPYLIASVVVALGALVGIVALSLLSGFVLARYKFPGRTFFFIMIAALMMVPGISSLIPLFIMMRDFGLLNTIPVLIVPHLAGGVVIGTILMKVYIEGIPQELFDSAQVDGASGPRMFLSIVMPLSLPVVGTLSLITINGVWNDFFWPLLTVTENDLRTVSVGLLFFQGQSGINYGPMSAGYLLASLPLLLLFTFLSKYFLAGIQGGLPGSN